ncbi:hypothetical protein PPACK8108_LOCUS8008 [Phakopsora pachyrhizi]|uniref:Uncharacterized protein n=1 Tax=Phakopsora pachyrhizi TaxID=170000 RepID=A0AAV0ATY3_PHAPC|nr:hypothetical protein PPACK8108_LOCUS8008 [Phakopsora pachyrhizi]
MASNKHSGTLLKHSPQVVKKGEASVLSHSVVEGLVKKEDEGKEVKGGLQGRCKEVFDKGVAMEGNEWCHWKEDQSGWSKNTGATDL